jgi:cytochrome c oxidase assembly protein subunit 15
MSRWPYRLALLLAVCTFPLIWVGGLVTSTDAGMAVPDWPTTYGYNLFLYPWTSWLFGPWDLFVEHGHRLLASAVGLLTLTLALAIWLQDSRRGVRRLALLAVALVCGQGVLGGMRVLWDERQLAMVHAMVGPAFFALAVALVFLTHLPLRGRANQYPPDEEPRDDALSCATTNAQALRSQALECLPARGVLRLAVPTAVLAYVQIVLGALVRHAPPTISPDRFRVYVYFHLAGAALLTGYVAALCWRLWVGHAAGVSPRRSGLLLAGVMLAQLALGAATWVARLGWPAWTEGWLGAGSRVIEAGGALQTYGVTAHVAAGALVLGIAIWIALEIALRSGNLGRYATASRGKNGSSPIMTQGPGGRRPTGVSHSATLRMARSTAPAWFAGGNRT